MSATIQPVPRPRGVLSEQTLDDLIRLCSEADEAERIFKARVVNAISEGSFSEVARVTGLSTNTLQRWKREASA